MAYAGAKQAYGILGMQRMNWQNVLRQTRGFSTTHSVYSFFLLNVKETLARGLLYPAKKVWEDIEFLHMVDESDLVICKFNKYIHDKRYDRPPMPLPPPPPTPPLQLLEVLLGSLDDKYFVHILDSMPRAHLPAYNWVDAFNLCSTATSLDEASHILLPLKVIAQKDNTSGCWYEDSRWSKKGLTRINDFREAQKKSILLLIRKQDVPELGFEASNPTQLLAGMPCLQRKWVEGQEPPGAVLEVSHQEQSFYVVRLPFKDGFREAARVGSEPDPKPSKHELKRPASQPPAKLKKKQKPEPRFKAERLHAGNECTNEISNTRCDDLAHWKGFSSNVRKQMSAGEYRVLKSPEEQDWQKLEAAQDVLNHEPGDYRKIAGWYFEKKTRNRSSVLHCKGPKDTCEGLPALAMALGLIVFVSRAPSAASSQPSTSTIEEEDTMDFSEGKQDAKGKCWECHRGKTENQHNDAKRCREKGHAGSFWRNDPREAIYQQALKENGGDRAGALRVATRGDSRLEDAEEVEAVGAEGSNADQVATAAPRTHACMHARTHARTHARPGQSLNHARGPD